MSNYWTASNKIPSLQKTYRIPAENGVEYNENQQIRIRVDPTIGWINPQGTSLEMKVKITPPTYAADMPPCKLALDEIGGQVLIRTCQVHNSDGVLLEEINNYNTMVSIKYDYETNKSIRNKRALTEGSGYYDHFNRGTVGTSKSIMNTCDQNPYFENPTSDPIATWASTNFIEAKITMPIHSGILSNDKIFPNKLCPLIITLTCEENYRVFRQMEGAMKFRRLPLCPLFHGITVGGASVPDNASFNVIYVKQSNALGGTAQRCPFVVGEILGIVRGNASLTEVDFVNASGDPTIVSIEKENNFTKLVLSGSVEVNGSGFDAAPENCYIFSKSVETATTYDCSYTISDVNLIVQEVIVPQNEENMLLKNMREGGTLEYDFLGVTNYRTSQLASDRVSALRLPIQNSMCRSIISCPTDASVYTNKQVLNASETSIQYEETSAVADRPDIFLRSSRPGLEGMTNSISNYQWIYSGKNQPNRRVSLSKTSSTRSIDGQHLIELSKALSQAGMSGLSFAKFNQNFIIGRSLSTGNGVYDGRNKDFILNVAYEEATAPAKNMLWMNFVYHIRKIKMSGNDVSVEI
tara:strand:+ start:4049 stop:5788 length:1740 start_codon:yes stop_codon:yes gene_type:complete